MIETRILSDPDLTVLAHQLHGKDVSQLHELAVMLIERGTKLVGLDDALADEVSDLLRKGKKIPQNVLEGLQTKADEADAHYLDILDAEGAESSRCLDAFGKARLLMAHCFAAQGKKLSLLDSIYESFLGTQRNPEMLDMIRRFASA
jgi:hypothetical protein